MDDITTLDVRRLSRQNLAPRWLPGEPSKRDTHIAAMLYEGYSPFSQTVSELSSIGAPTLESCSTFLWLADRIRHGWTIPAPPTAASIWVLTSTSCRIVPQPADEWQHRGREKAADEQSGERASRLAMRAIPTPKDKRRIARVSVWCRPHRAGTRFRG